MRVANRPAFLSHCLPELRQETHLFMTDVLPEDATVHVMFTYVISRCIASYPTRNRLVGTA
jgi:hypothetical protein